MQKRLNFLWFVFLIIWISLVYRVFTIQVFKSDQYSRLGKNQHFREEVLPASRGDILDRSGNSLATDLAFYEFSAEPPRVKDAWKIATVFSQYSDKSFDDYLKLLRQDRKFVYLDRKVPALQAEKILRRDLAGVYSTANFKRFYPQGNITGSFTGFTNIDNEGIEGLEYRYDTFLAGVPGRRIVKTDARGNRKVDFNYPVQNPKSGNTIITTVDLDIQTIVVEELSKAVNEYKALSGTAIMMDPLTGAVLAMVTLPTFDSNNPQSSPVHLRKNRSINDTFEPGSIFKLVTAAAALEMKIISPEYEIYCENGILLLGNRVFRDSKPHGMMTFYDIIVKSSNIGTYKIAKMVGEKSIYKFARNFGFGSKSGIDLNGESSGLLRPVNQWTSHSLASIAIGQEMTVNAMQMVSAYAVVANGGTLMKPFIVKSIVSPEGKILEEFGPEKIRRVISKQTAETLTAFFRGVVDSGTAVAAQIPGSSLAGKTGTAQKFDPEIKAYSETDYISSFVSFYPAEDPKIVGIVILDSPKGVYYGGHVAGPVMKKILTRITYKPGNTLFASSVPEGGLTKRNGKQKSIWETIKGLWSDSLSDLREPAGDINTMVGSDFGTGKPEDLMTITVERKKSINDIDKESSDKNEKIATAPDVMGLTIREAVRLLNQNGFDFEVSGSGYVASQTPKPGASISPGATLWLVGKNDGKYSKNNFR